jgi:hypothetical protein
MSTHPPWTDEQVNKLNEWQACDWVHEFTCGNDADPNFVLSHEVLGKTLVASNDGWHCLSCGYTQTWAHDFMLKGAPPKPEF